MGSRLNASHLAAVLAVAGVTVFDPGGLFSFGPSKWLAITGLVAVGLVAVAGEGARLGRGEWLAAAGVIAWCVVTAVAGVDPLSAFLGTPDRRFGVVGVATVIGAYILGRSIDTDDRRAVLVRSFVVATLLLGVGAIGELAGWDMLDVAGGRVGSTYGTPAYLGAALCVLIPICLATTFAADSRGWSWLAGTASVVGMLTLGWSGTRAAIVGLVAGAVVLIAARNELPTAWRRGLALTALAFVAVMVISPLGQRIFMIPDDPLALGRVDEWSVATVAIAQRPVFGWGLEGYRIAFPSAVNEDYVVAYGRSAVTDRAHSAPLDWAAATGLPGLVGWIVLASWLVKRAWQAAKLGTLGLGLAAATVAYLAQELFLFTTLEVGVLAAVAAGAMVSNVEPSRSTTSPSRPLMALATLAAVGLVVGGVGDVVADRSAGAALGTTSVATADRARQIRPDSFRYALVAAEVARRAGDLDVARARVARARSLSPLDPALRLAELQILADAVTSGGVRPSDATSTATAALAADPLNPEVKLNASIIFAAAGDPGRAEAELLRAETLAPSDPAIPSLLADLYEAVGEIERADAARLRAREILENSEDS